MHIGVCILESMTDLSLFLLLLELFEHGFEFCLFLLCLFNRGLVLLLIGHGHHSQDQIHQVEGAHKDDQHKEDHVCLPCSSKSLTENTDIA